MISVQVQFPDLTDLLKNEERDIMRLVTFGTAGRMKALIAEPKSGREYPRGKKTHIASAPGESLANDSGDLIGTIMPNMKDFETGEILLAEHGLFGEFGTVYMDERPTIIPALEDILQSL